jgi:hypothetical protein
MLSGTNAFRISDHHQLNPRQPEDGMQQCYMPCGRRNNNSPATRWVNDCENRWVKERENPHKISSLIE